MSRRRATRPQLPSADQLQTSWLERWVTSRLPAPALVDAAAVQIAIVVEVITVDEEIDRFLMWEPGMAQLAVEEIVLALAETVRDGREEADDDG